MKIKTIVTIVLLIILFYLLFMKKVEGMEENMVIEKEEQVKGTSIFSFLEGLLRLFDFSGDDYGEQSCQINSDDLSDDFQKNIDNINCYSNEGDNWEKSKINISNNILSIKFYIYLYFLLYRIFNLNHNLHFQNQNHNLYLIF